jgi:hypothetical protein
LRGAFMAVWERARPVSEYARSASESTAHSFGCRL